MKQKILKFNEVHMAMEGLGFSTSWEFFSEEIKEYSEKELEELLGELNNMY